MKPGEIDKLAIIIIIGYKSSLSENEKASLRQCYKILHGYPIRIVSPKGMDVSEYKKVITDIQFEYVDPKWTSSYLMNSQFKTNSWLYNRYRDYGYLLFYELDCWVFRDELEYWCKKKWDYIGAPWFRGYEAGDSDQITGVGNGGFSLRNNKSSLRMTKRIQFLKKLRNAWFKYYLQPILPFEKLVRIFKKQLHIQQPSALTSLLLDQYILEDIYWTEKIATVFDDFRVASIEDAVKFGFELNPSLLYKMNLHQLPFGCHHWEKYEPEFWKQFIPQLSLELKDA